MEPEAALQLQHELLEKGRAARLLLIDEMGPIVTIHHKSQQF
jgi:hypothetical protein